MTSEHVIADIKQEFDDFDIKEESVEDDLAKLGHSSQELKGSASCAHSLEPKRKCDAKVDGEKASSLRCPFFVDCKRLEEVKIEVCQDSQSGHSQSSTFEETSQPLTESNITSIVQPEKVISMEDVKEEMDDVEIKSEFYEDENEFDLATQNTEMEPSWHSDEEFTSSSGGVKMLTDEELSCICIAVAVSVKQKAKKRHRRWTKEWLKKRDEYTHEHLLNDLRLTEVEDYRLFLRLDVVTFEELLCMIKPQIEKRNTVMRDAIPSSQRLSITLRYLATGNTFEDLKYTSAISPQSISNIIMETCTALIHSLKKYIEIPKTESEWKAVANGFQEQWNFPHCLGAIDGKHVAIKKPPHSGSLYYNHKKFFSIVLLAAVNSNYEFIMVDAGVNGRISDGGVLSHTAFGRALANKKLRIPEPATLPNSEKKAPFVFVCDDAFPLTENLMKPYAQIGLTDDGKMFNYRLSRARRIVENAFDILTTKFGVFQRPIGLSPEKAQVIVLTCCYLHNYLRRNQKKVYFSNTPLDVEKTATGAINDGQRRTNGGDTTPLQNSNSRNSSTNAKIIRDTYCAYFSNEGQVSWQQ